MLFPFAIFLFVYIHLPYKKYITYSRCIDTHYCSFTFYKQMRYISFLGNSMQLKQYIQEQLNVVLYKKDTEIFITPILNVTCCLFCYQTFLHQTFSQLQYLEKIFMIRIYSDGFSCSFLNNLRAQNFILIYITVFVKLDSATYC